MVYVMLGTGFEEVEALTPVDLLRRAGVEVQTVGINGKIVSGGHGIPVTADIELGEMDLTQMEMIVLPGGLGGVASIRASEQTLDAVRFARENGRFVAAICAAPTILADLGMLSGKKVTCYPGQVANMGDADADPAADVCIDYADNIITGRSAGTATPFALALIEVLKGREAADAVDKQIVRCW